MWDTNQVNSINSSGRADSEIDNSHREYTTDLSQLHNIPINQSINQSQSPK